MERHDQEVNDNSFFFHFWDNYPFKNKTDASLYDQRVLRRLLEYCINRDHKSSTESSLWNIQSHFISKKERENDGKRKGESVFECHTIK